jgi:hypothetical protein
MSDYAKLLAKLTAPNPREVFEQINAEKPPSYSPPRRMFIKSDIQPVELYCYLYARFGPPNGIQNALRTNDSQNMFHWHYSLWADGVGIELMAATYKIEVWYPEAVCYSDHPLEGFVRAIIADLPTYRQQAKEIKAKLEKWLVFANPFYRLQLALTGMLERAAALLQLTKHPPKQPETSEESTAFGKLFQPVANASYEAFGLGRSVRMLLPVLAETFVNFMLFILCKPEIKADERLYESVKRAPIDIRIKSLSHNCLGFAESVNYTTDVCKRLHTMFNNRNNLLHGNVNPPNDYHEVVYFNGTIPLFTEWLDFYQRCFGAQLKNNDYDCAVSELADVMAFVEQVIGSLQPNVQLELRKLLEFSDLGYNPQTKRVGLLFPNVLVDYVIEFESRPSSTQ